MSMSRNIGRLMQILKRKPTIRQKGNVMQKTLKHEDIKKILDDADELLWKVDPKFIESIEEENKRIDLEQQAQTLKQLKMEAQSKIGKVGTQEGGSYGDGMHEAIEAIVEAMKKMAGYFS